MQDSYSSQISNIYAAYLNVISPLVIQLENLDGEFPVEILNEVRSIFTHLARCDASKDDLYIKENLTKAERHVKRAVLDCFKYLCVSYDEKIKEFEELYKNVDLSYVDNGKFLQKFSSLKKGAIESKKQAQNKELKLSHDEDVFTDFEHAYNNYAAVYSLIQDEIPSVEFLKHKAAKKTILNNIFGIAGLIGVGLSVLFFFLQK